MKRQPVVVVLGHVDHGKTSLLDALRKTDIAASEAGGITQSIGASKVTFVDDNNQIKSICFIDTPGHAVFSNMRFYGSKAADIALLVLDSSSGIKPQTKEAIAVINEAKLPFIVVCTKIDLPSASVETVLSELEKEGLYFEGRGGQIPYIGVSAKKGEGLKELLNLISLLADISDIEADSDGQLEAVVIEASKEKGGNMVSIVVKNGKLEIGQEVYSQTAKGKVKGLFDDNNKPIKKVLPGEPARILGFESLPIVGSVITDRQINEQDLPSGLSSLKQNTKSFDKTKTPLYLKADNVGSLEALVASIPGEFVILEANIGGVTESDILNAKANNATIFAFKSKISASVKKLAEMEKVELENFNVIYELLEKLDQIIKDRKVEILGKAEILAEFPFDKKRVAGSRILQGRIEKTSDVSLMRAGKELGKTKILSIKKQKTEVSSVSQGEECGILFAPQLDFQIGDVIIAVRN